ncbi:MAG: sarcosine oxidase subunit delta [Porticoccaceae bacterium]|jgi:heterotetrameric sarcosine oxidase delta subunit|tara:strand:- start:317 stop:607 length:291 start_codon:yes stop_codon:yes gene_type:complete
MLLIHCPHCQENRDEEEFSYGGEAHIVRPLEPEALNDQAWADYLFFRTNSRGIHHEMWYHAMGCRRYFNATRNTLTYEILETYKTGTQPTIVGASA